MQGRRGADRVNTLVSSGVVCLLGRREGPLFVAYVSRVDVLEACCYSYEVCIHRWCDGHVSCTCLELMRRVCCALVLLRSVVLPIKAIKDWEVLHKRIKIVSCARLPVYVK